MNTKKKLKHLKLFDQHKIVATHNRVRPTNDFLEFRKEDIYQSICSCFEKKADTCPGKIAVKSGDKSITYRFLNNYANRLAHAIAKTYKKPAGTTRHTWQAAALLFAHGTDMIIGMMGVLKAGITYVPLDPTYPRDRLKFILADSMAQLIVTHTRYYQLAQELKNSMARPIEIINISDFDGDIEPAAYPSPGISIHPDQVAYVLYTSGSTGKPKGVMQSHKNVLHFARVYTNALHIHAGDRLTLLSSYSFDAAKMDIFGALLNGATLYPFDVKQEENLERLPRWLIHEKITIYHSIPTLYRYFINLLPNENKKNRAFPYIRFVVMGGEAVNRNDVEKYKEYFSHHCIFINGLGPTESTVTLQYFIDKKSQINKSCVPVGFPVDETQVFLLDKNNEPTVVNAVGEIVYKSDYLALGYLNKPEKSNEVFGKDPIANNGRIYRSGDLGIRLANGCTEYVGREDSQVKIRGYRIELGEIETQLLRHESIKEAVVINKEKENGETYLCAYIVSQQIFAPGQAKNFLSTILPNYMIPSYFVTLNNIPLTPSGKVDRKALPPVDLAAVNEYTAPADALEKRLVEIWSDVLGIDESKISTNANFFELGGHSLKATALASRIHKSLQVKILLTEIFKRQTIRELSKYIKGTVKEKYANIELVEKKEYYPLSSAQLRLYFLQQMNPQSTAYNIPRWIPLDPPLPLEKLEQTFIRLIHHHESLRTSFHMVNNEPVQRVHDHVEFKIGNWTPQTKEAFIGPFDLSQAPLVRAGLEKFPNGNQVLHVYVHHIIVDNLSYGIMFLDYIDLFVGKELAPLRIQYKDFTQWQNKAKQKDELKHQESYWLKEFEKDIPVLRLATDYERSDEIGPAGKFVVAVIEKDELEVLKSYEKSEMVTIYMALMAIFNVLLFKITGQEDIVIGTLAAGRGRADLENIIGMFVNTVAVRNFPRSDMTFKQFLRHTKTRTLQALSNQDYQFEDLVEKVVVKREKGRNPIFDVSYNFFSLRDSLQDIGLGEIDERRNWVDLQAKFDMGLLAIEKKDFIMCLFGYRSNLFKRETIERFSRYLKEIISAVVKNEDIILGDITFSSDLGEAKSDFIKEDEMGFGF
jgi:amino acid adenylation domain-containing protein